jgi:hypothetical protein
MSINNSQCACHRAERGPTCHRQSMLRRWLTTIGPRPRHRDLATDTVCDFASDSRRANPWAADLYNRAVARGHDHPHATRILARAWLYIIWRWGTIGSPTTPRNTEPSRPWCQQINRRLDTGLLMR